MVSGGIVNPSDPEGDLADDILHDPGDVFLYIVGISIGHQRQVTTTDIEPDSGDRYMVTIGDHSADGLRVTLMTVSTQHSMTTASVKTSSNLLKSSFIMGSEYS